MRSLRRGIKEVLVLMMGAQEKPRRILRGLASGCRIVVSPKENLGYLFGITERHLQRAIRKYVNQGDTVYDVGANIGYVSLSLSMCVGHSGKVYAFEPLPENLARLLKGIEASRKENITVLDFAASNAKGTTLIRTTGNHSMASLVWHRDDPAATERLIRTECIDEWVKSGDLPTPTFVKIDVEGAEGYVIQGMKHTIAAALPIIFIECSDAGREITWQVLKELGYRCESAVTGESVEEFGGYRHADYLWLPPRIPLQRPGA